MSSSPQCGLARAGILFLPVVLVLVIVSLSCSRPPAPDPAYVAELEAERAKRLASLTSENGWLTVVGLSWLEPGENSFGSDPAAAVVLKAPGIPPRAGFFDVKPDGTVVLRVDLLTGMAKEPAAPITVNGTGTMGATLATDRTGKPDRITVGPLRLTVLQRADKLAVRVKDPESPARDRKALLSAYSSTRYQPVSLSPEKIPDLGHGRCY